MCRPKAPDPPFLYIVVRVDDEYPRTWFSGYKSNHECKTTSDISEAACVNLDSARLAVESLKFDIGGVWGIRRVKEEGDVDD